MTPGITFLRLVLLCALLCGVGACYRPTTPEEEAALAQQQAAQLKSDQAVRAERAARDRQIAQASSNLGPISQAVTTRGDPALGAGIEAQKRDIDSALGMPRSEYPTPVVDLRKLLEDSAGALADYRAQSMKLQSNLDSAAAQAAEATRARMEAEAVAKHEKAKADAAASREWWYGAGLTALTTLGALAGLAARLGLPGGGLVAAAFDVITPMVKRRRVAAETAVAAADVGRQALSLLETHLSRTAPEVASKLSAIVSDATDGRADGLNALFKAVSKSYVLDQHGEHAEAVDSLLTDIRGRSVATTGGIADALTAIVPALSRRAT